MHRYKGSHVKKSIDAYTSFLEELSKNGHCMKSEYINSSTKVLVDFGCGHIPHMITPNDYKSGRRCPRCSGKHIGYAKETFVELVKESGHELLSEYINSSTKVLVDFKCGHKPNHITPNSYKNGHRCPVCGGRDKKNSYIEFIEVLHKNNHKLLSEYINARTKVLIDFGCNHEPSLITPDSYKRGTRCSKCSGFDPEEQKEKFLKKVNDNGHIILSEYKNATTKVLIDFKCGHKEHWISPNQYNCGKSCPVCANKDIEEIVKNFKKLVSSNNHILMTEYKNKSDKVLIDFRCGHEPHWISPDNYKHGYGCPKCCLSKGEVEVSKVLEEMEIRYKIQHSFQGLYFKKRLKFDFYIPDKNICIEYDGQQHYEPVDFSGNGEEWAVKQFEKVKHRDYIKNEYCKKNDIKLIRIPYWKHNEIKKMLLKELID